MAWSLSRRVVLVILTLGACALPACLSASAGHGGSGAAAGTGYGASCEAAGQTFADGQTFSDGCYECTCDNGVAVDCWPTMSSSNIDCYGDLYPPDSGPAPVCDPADVAVSPDPAPVFVDNDRMALTRSLTDDSGFTYIVGDTAKSGDLGNGAYLIANQLSKLDPNGQIVWTQQVRSEVNSYTGPLAFADNGDILVGGLSYVLNANWDITSTKFWILRYDSEGNLIIADEAPAVSGPGFMSQLLETPTGEIELWGSFAGLWTVGSTTIDGGDYSQTFPQGFTQGFRLQFSASGSVTALDRIGDTDAHVVADAVNDGAGMTYVALSAAPVLPSTYNPPRGVIVAFDSQMNPVWSRDLDAYTYALRLAIDNGVLVAVGTAMGEYSPDGTIPETLFVGQFRLDTGEPVLWKSYSIGNLSGSYPQAVTSLAVLPNSDIVMGGQLPTGVTLGDTTLRSAMGYGPFIGRFTAAGDPVWATLYCSASGGQIDALDSGGGSLKAVVSSSGEVEFGSFQLPNESGIMQRALIQLPADKVQ